MTTIIVSRPMFLLGFFFLLLLLLPVLLCGGIPDIWTVSRMAVAVPGPAIIFRIFFSDVVCGASAVIGKKTILKIDRDF